MCSGYTFGFSFWILWYLHDLLFFKPSLADLISCSDGGVELIMFNRRTRPVCGTTLTDVLGLEELSR